MSILSREQTRDGCLDKQELQAKASAPTEEGKDHSMSTGTTAMALGWEGTVRDRCHCACSHTSWASLALGDWKQVTEIQWVATGKQLIIGSSPQFPTIMAETEKEGFLLWQKILLPGDTLALWHLCKASLHCSPWVWQGHGLPRAHVAVTTPVSVYDHPREASTQGT